MDVTYFVPDQDPTVASKLPISTDTDPASFHIAGPLIAGYDAAAATTCNTAIDSCTYVLKVEPPTPAWYINSDTGEVFGKFLDDDNGKTFMFSVYASDAFDPGYTDGLVEEFAITAFYPDKHLYPHGPNGEGCHVNGTAEIVDTDLFDGIFSCRCNDGWVNDNCDFDQTSHHLRLLQAEKTASGIAGGAVGGTVFLITFGVLVYRCGRQAAQTPQSERPGVPQRAYGQTTTQNPAYNGAAQEATYAEINDNTDYEIPGALLQGGQLAQQSDDDDFNV